MRELTFAEKADLCRKARTVAESVNRPWQVETAVRYIERVFRHICNTNQRFVDDVRICEEDRVLVEDLAKLNELTLAKRT